MTTIEWEQLRGTDNETYWYASVQCYELTVDASFPGGFTWKIVHHNRIRRWYAHGCKSVEEAKRECERFLKTVREESVRGG